MSIVGPVIVDGFEGMKALADEIGRLKAELAERRERRSAHDRLRSERDRQDVVIDAQAALILDLRRQVEALSGAAL